MYTAPPEEGGVPVNPSTVALTITLPDGTTTAPTPANTATGKYKVDFVPTQAGRHLIRWVTTGPATAFTDVIDVRSGAPAYIVSLASVKRHLGKSLTDTADDEELREFIEAATALVEDIRGEVVVRRTVLEDVDLPHGTRAILLSKTPVLSLASVAAVDGSTTWNVADLHTSGIGVVTARSGQVFWGLVRFTYVAGYTVIPANFSLAAKVIVEHLWETQQQPNLGPRPFGDGGEVMTVPGRGYAIPNRAVQLLGGGRGPLVA